MTLYSALL